MNTTEILHRARQIFSQEAADLLQGLDDALLALEADPQNADLINSVFRPMHTLKGSSATSGMSDLAAYLHRGRGRLQCRPRGRILLVPEIIDPVAARLRCRAQLQSLAGKNKAGNSWPRTARSLIRCATFLPSENPVAAATAPGNAGTTGAQNLPRRLPAKAIDLFFRRRRRSVF